ncbi:hypothetical protein [Asaia prunellae]|uniref:hypothetical protein n=1 Tax=Asaia prunellae TaxID=610245 RepID=UPI000B0787D3|nr:hypothetical protein [Asaia prunellae]
MNPSLHRNGASWYEASARERIAGLLDPHSFREYLGPSQAIMSLIWPCSICHLLLTMVLSLAKAGWMGVTS